MSELLLDEGVFVTGFGYPVVPQGVGARSVPTERRPLARRHR